MTTRRQRSRHAEFIINGTRIDHRPILRSQVMNGVWSISSSSGQLVIGVGMNHATDQFSDGAGLSPKNSALLCLTVGKMSGSAVADEATV